MSLSYQSLSYQEMADIGNEITASQDIGRSREIVSNLMLRARLLELPPEYFLGLNQIECDLSSLTFPQFAYYAGVLMGIISKYEPPHDLGQPQQ